MSGVAQLILGASRVTVICHENPDADTLGAALAIRTAAERLGKEAEVICADPAPPTLAFLPGVERVAHAPSLEPDVAVIVDAGDLSRIGSIADDHADWLARSRVANVDHHVSNPGFGEAQLVDPGAAATCELVVGLLADMGVELDAELATLLLAGIVNDTHTFAHPNVTPQTLRVAAALVEAGAPLAAINRAIYVDKPFATLALWGQILAGVQRRCGGRIVHADMTLEMLASLLWDGGTLIVQTPNAAALSRRFWLLMAGTVRADPRRPAARVTSASTRSTS